MKKHLTPAQEERKDIVDIWVENIVKSMTSRRTSGRISVRRRKSAKCPWMGWLSVVLILLGTTAIWV